MEPAASRQQGMEPPASTSGMREHAASGQEASGTEAPASALTDVCPSRIPPYPPGRATAASTRTGPCWLYPAQYRTRLCKDEVGCARRICFFAHRRDELRAVRRRLATPTLLPAPSPTDPGPRAPPPDGDPERGRDEETATRSSGRRKTKNGNPCDGKRKTEPPGCGIFF